jgi:hypothetical protein
MKIFILALILALFKLYMSLRGTQIRLNCLTTGVGVASPGLGFANSQPQSSPQKTTVGTPQQTSSQVVGVQSNSKNALIASSSPSPVLYVLPQQQNKDTSYVSDNKQWGDSSSVSTISSSKSGK